MQRNEILFSKQSIAKIITIRSHNSSLPQSRRFATGSCLVTKCGVGLNERYWILGVQYLRPNNIKVCGPIAPYGPTVYRCFFADLLLACCTSIADTQFILRIYCGSTAWEPVDFCESIVRFTLQVIACVSTADLLWAYCSLRAHCL